MNGLALRSCCEHRKKKRVKFRTSILCSRSLNLSFHLFSLKMRKNLFILLFQRVVYSPPADPSKKPKGAGELRLPNVRDRKENVRDRREDIRDRREDIRDSRN